MTVTRDANHLSRPPRAGRSSCLGTMPTDGMTEDGLRVADSGRAELATAPG